MHRSLLFFILAGLLISGGLVSAQSIPDVGVPEFDPDVLLSLSPQYPAPYENVVIRAEHFLVDLDRAMITWTVNGNVVQEGIGQDNISISAGGAGETLSVTVTAEDPTGEVGTGEISFTPADIDIIWEAHTYTPPFYKGKALNTSESRITLEAIPYFKDVSGNVIPSSNILFEWSTEKGTDSQASGLGRTSYELNSDRVQTNKTITVTARTFDDTQYAQDRRVFISEVPEVYVYEQHPLLGVLFNRALTDTFLIREDAPEITLRAIPYFFSTSAGGNPGMQYNWIVDGQNAPGKTPLITLRKQGRSGRSQIDLAVDRLEYYFQKATTDLIMEF